jgi:hypothetical protein
MQSRNRCHDVTRPSEGPGGLSTRRTSYLNASLLPAGALVGALALVGCSTLEHSPRVSCRRMTLDSCRSPAPLSSPLGVDKSDAA